MTGATAEGRTAGSGSSPPNGASRWVGYPCMASQGEGNAVRIELALRPFVRAFTATQDA